MSKKLTEFLTNLSTDDTLAKAFKKDKEKTMKAHGISDEHIQLVINKKYDEIQKILGANYGITINDLITAFKK